MGKRILAAILWFYAGWYLGAFIAAQLGITWILGPWLGAVAAALFAGDPRGIIWKSTPPEGVVAGVVADAEPPTLAERLPAEPGLGEVLASR